MFHHGRLLYHLLLIPPSQTVGAHPGTDESTLQRLTELIRDCGRAVARTGGTFGHVAFAVHSDRNPISLTIGTERDGRFQCKRFR
jgi:hypothetical protein